MSGIALPAAASSSTAVTSAGLRSSTSRKSSGHGASTSSRIATAASISASVTSSDGASRSAVGVTALTTRPRSRQAPRERGGVRAGCELDRDEQARRRGRRATPGSARSAFVSRSPACGRAPGHVLALHHVEHRQRGARRERLAAERRGVVAGPERLGDVGARPARADRHAVAERLRHRHDVGAHVAAVLEPEPAPGAAEPGLHLVDDQQRLALVAQARAPLRGSRAAPAARRLRPGPLRAAPRRPARPSRHASASRSANSTWRKPVGSGWNVSCFCGWPVAASVRERAAVERVVGREHVEALRAAVRLAVTAGELDRALVGLGAGVREEHPARRAGRRREQQVEPLAELRAAPRCSRGSRRAAACSPGRRSRRRPRGARDRAT